MDRSFEIMGVAADLSPQSIVRWILTELHEDQMSVSRVTLVWPPCPKPNQALGPAKVVVVLQSDGAKEAALRFHKNERFAANSCEWRGLICLEPRPDITNYSRRHEPPPDWSMEEVWDRLGAAEMADRERLRGFTKWAQANHGASSPTFHQTFASTTWMTSEVSNQE